MPDDTELDDEFFDLVLYHSGPGGGRITLGPAAEWDTWWRVAARRAPGAGLPPAAHQGFVLSTADLRHAGVTRQQVRTKVEHGSWSAPRTGFVGMVDATASHGVGSDRWSVERREHALACSAASLENPGFVVSRQSAAILTGLPTLVVPSSPLLTATPDLRSRRHAAARIDADERADWYGVPLTSVARTVVDVARHDRRDGIITADAALRERLTDPTSLERAVHRAAGGSVSARPAKSLPSQTVDPSRRSSRSPGSRCTTPGSPHRSRSSRSPSPAGVTPTGSTSAGLSSGSSSNATGASSTTRTGVGRRSGARSRCGRRDTASSGCCGPTSPSTGRPPRPTSGPCSAVLSRHVVDQQHC